jgi:hypothetical protein
MTRDWKRPIIPIDELEFWWNTEHGTRNTEHFAMSGEEMRWEEEGSKRRLKGRAGAKEHNSGTDPRLEAVAYCVRWSSLGLWRRAAKYK